LFANQPPEHTGGSSTEDLLEFGGRTGLTNHDYVTAVQEGRCESWVGEIDKAFEEQDPDGTPSLCLTPDRLTPRRSMTPTVSGR
jgi:hypothetical protein